MAVKLTQKDIKILRKRFEAANNERLLWDDVWDRAYKFAVPHLRMTSGNASSGFLKENAGEDLNIHIYDTTLARSTNVFASKMFNGLTPIGQKWAKFEVGDEVKKKVGNISPIQEELDEINDTIFQFINASNFYEEMGGAYENFSIGTMALLVNFNPHNRARPFVFESVNPQVLAIELTSENKAENVWRLLHKKISDILQIWPTAKLTSDLKQRMKSDPLTSIKLVEGTLFQPDKNNFLHVVLSDKNEVLLSDENESSPWIITRFSTRPNEAFGRGRVLTALHAAITLNKMVFFILQQAQIDVAPPLMINSQSQINPANFRFGPNMLVPVQSMDEFKRIPIGGNFEISEKSIGALREQIEAVMLTNPMGALNTPAKTATEISGRINETVEELSPTIGRFTAEFYQTLFERLLFITKQNGLATFITTKGLAIRRNEIKLTYTAPLIRGQEALDFQAINEFVAFFQRTLGPELAPKVLHESLVPEYISKLLHVPERFIKTPEEINRELQLAVQEEQQQQAQANPSPGQQAQGALQNASQAVQSIGSQQTPTGT